MRQHFDQCPIGLVIADPNTGTFLRVNDYFCELLGRTEEELTSKPWATWVHPDDQAATEGARIQLTHRAPVSNFRNRYLTVGGAWMTIDWWAQVSPDDGLLYAACAPRMPEALSVHDALSRLRSGGMADDGRLLRHILDNLPHGVLIRRDDGGEAEMNAVGKAMCGLDPDRPYPQEKLNEVLSTWNPRARDGRPLKLKETPIWLALQGKESKRVVVVNVNGEDKVWSVSAFPVFSVLNPNIVAYAVSFFAECEACQLNIDRLIEIEEGQGQRER